MSGNENPDLPIHLQLTIFGFVPLEQRLSYRIINKDWKKCIESDPTFWVDSGAIFFEDCMQRLTRLPRPLAKLVYHKRLSLMVAEEVQKFWEESPENKWQHVLNNYFNYDNLAQSIFNRLKSLSDYQLKEKLKSFIHQSSPIESLGKHEVEYIFKTRLSSQNGCLVLNRADA